MKSVWEARDDIEAIASDWSRGKIGIDEFRKQIEIQLRAVAGMENH